MKRFSFARQGGYTLLTLPGLAIVAFFFLLPLGVVLATSLSGPGGAFSRVFSDTLFFQGLAGSLLLSVSAGGLSLLAGFFIALRLSRLEENTRTFLMLLISLPLTFSGMVVAYGFILSFGRAGFFTMLLAYAGVDPAKFSGFIYSPLGLSFAYCYYLIPRVVFMLLPVLINFDSSKLLAAESFGAGKMRRIVEILIPEIYPAVVSSFCLVFAVAFGAYGTALALTGTQLNILPLQLYSRISDAGSDFPAAAALSVVLLFVSTLVLSMGEFYAYRRGSDQP